MHQYEKREYERVIREFAELVGINASSLLSDGAFKVGDAEILIQSLGELNDACPILLAVKVDCPDLLDRSEYHRGLLELNTNFPHSFVQFGLLPSGQAIAKRTFMVDASTTGAELQAEIDRFLKSISALQVMKTVIGESCE